MQATFDNWTGSSADAEPVWFDGSKFDDQSFDANAYVDDLKRYVSLDDLRAKLISYAEGMRAELVELVNEDYDEFVSLSTKLVNVDEAIEVLETPILSIKQHVEEVRQQIQRHSSALKEAIQRRHAVSEVRGLLEVVQEAVHSLSKVEKLAESVSEIELSANGDEVDSSFVNEKRCKMLDRICSELGKVIYVLHENKNVRIIELMSQRVEQLQSQIDANLEEALVKVLRDQDPTSLGTLLHAYASVGRIESAQNIIRRHVVNPFALSIGENTDGENASHLMNRISDGLKRELWPFLEVVASTTGSTLPYDIPGSVVLPELVSLVANRFPGMYSPGNPVDFHQNFTAYQKLCGVLESVCKSNRQVERFRSSEAYIKNISRWNLAAYFSLKFQDIAMQVEESILNAEKESVEEELMTESGGPCHWEVSNVCLSCLASCVSSNVVLDPIADKFLRLQLQIVSRYCSWIYGNLERHREGVGYFASLPADRLLLLALDATTLAQKWKLAVQSSDLIDKLGSRALHLTRELLHDSLQKLEVASKDLIDLCARKISRLCCEYFGQIRGIVATFRMTARAPTNAAQYASMILKPLSDFLRKDAIVELDADVKSSLVQRALAETANTYIKVAEETLDTARKTEMSLKKLKSRKTINPSDEDLSLSTDKMIEFQLSLDVQEFVRQAQTLVPDLTSVPAIENLKQTFTRTSSA